MIEDVKHPSYKAFETTLTKLADKKKFDYTISRTFYCVSESEALLGYPVTEKTRKVMKCYLRCPNYESGCKAKINFSFSGQVSYLAGSITPTTRLGGM